MDTLLQLDKWKVTRNCHFKWLFVYNWYIWQRFITLFCIKIKVQNSRILQDMHKHGFLCEVHFTACVYSIVVFQFTTRYVLPVMTCGSFYVECSFHVSCCCVKSVESWSVARVVVRVQDVGVSSAGTQTWFLSHRMAVHVPNSLSVVEVGDCKKIWYYYSWKTVKWIGYFNLLSDPYLQRLFRESTLMIY